MLRQRRARVVSDELREGSGLFSVLAHLPVQSCFGFVDDMRRRSSGAASASLMLSHWERLQVSCRGVSGELTGVLNNVSVLGHAFLPASAHVWLYFAEAR